MSNYIFINNNKEFLLPCTIRNVKKIPKDKENQLNLLLDHCRYEVQSKVRDEILVSFLKYWDNNELPQITVDNIWEYEQLSREFGLLTEHLKQEKYIPFYNLDILINLNEHNNFDKSIIEEKISQNLNHYLTNFFNDLKKVPINSLYNIFHHPKRENIDHDLAYRFVNEDNNENRHLLYILLDSLDSKEMKLVENRRNSVMNRSEHFNFAPRNSEKYILEVEEKLSKCEQNHLNDLEKIKSLKTDLQNANMKIEELDSEKEKLIDQLNKSDNNYKVATLKIEKLDSEKEKLIDQLNKSDNNYKEATLKIEKLDSENEKLIDQLNKSDNNYKVATLKIEKLDSEKEKLIDQLNKSDNNYKEATLKIENLNSEKEKLIDQLNKSDNNYKVATLKIEKLDSEKGNITMQLNTIKNDLNHSTNENCQLQNSLKKLNEAVQKHQTQNAKLKQRALQLLQDRRHPHRWGPKPFMLQTNQIAQALRDYAQKEYEENTRAPRGERHQLLLWAPELLEGLLSLANDIANPPFY